MRQPLTGWSVEYSRRIATVMGAYIRSSVSDCKASERHEAEEINDYYDEHHASLPKSATLLIQAITVLAPEQRGRPGRQGGAGVIVLPQKKHRMFIGLTGG